MASRPTGWVTEQNFRVESAPIPQPQDGEVLVKNEWLSLDPYMRGRMNDVKSYAAKQEIGAVMVGGTAGEVVESRNPKFKPGDKVVGQFGWQQYGVSDGKMLNKVDASRIPLSAYLGVAGHARRHGLGRPARHLRAEGGRDGRGVRRFRRGRQRGGADREAERLPRSGHRRRRGEVRLRGQRAWLRRLHRLQGRQAPRRPESTRRPRASTAISRTSAARSWTPCCGG